MTTTESWSFGPLNAAHFQRPGQAHEALQAIAKCGVSIDLLEPFWRGLASQLPHIDDPDAVVQTLRELIGLSRSPTSLLALFERDPSALISLVQVLSIGPVIARLLLADPESFDLVRASDGGATSRGVLIDELVGETRTIANPQRAALTLQHFVSREVLRIAYGEFVRGMSPERAQHQLSDVYDAVLHAALEFVITSLVARLGLPQRVDGNPPRWAVIALGSFGGQEIGYDTPLDLVLVCDQIDRKNVSHVEFNRQLAADLIEMCRGENIRSVLPKLRFDHQVGHEDTVGTADPLVDFFGLDEAAEYYERTSRTWQRLAFVKARFAAGDAEIGRAFIHRLQPWVYHHLLSRSEIADVRVLQRKLEKRSESDLSVERFPIASAPGGRRDIELTIQFLQLLHGSELPDVRQTNTLDAIAALGRAGCLTQQEASLLSDNHARLCRLEHHLSVLRLVNMDTSLDDQDMRERLAWRLGVRLEGPGAGALRPEHRSRGDVDRFEKLLWETFDVNRRIINHLMVDGDPAKNDDVPTHVSGAIDGLSEEPNAVAIETELILDPDPDIELFRETLQARNFSDVDAAIEHVLALSNETVKFLSPRRCRHFFAAVAPGLLAAIAQTPDPDCTLARLVEVTDSIGAKATLWELLRTNRATMELTVRMCALAPYLSEILIQNPGMIDELIDSLVMDRLPTAERLDAQSIRMCEGVDSIGSVLRNFKASAHLMIGVRDLLDKEPIEAIGRAVSDTSESCLRRIIQREHESLASRFGDPLDDDEQPVELVAIALGKFGGRETNVHSDLELSFVYTAEGQTHRRIGGARTTLSNRQFFNQLTQNIIRQLTQSPDGRLAEVVLPLAGGPDKEVVTVSLPMFLKPLRQQTASAWHRLTLCKARPISGSRAVRTMVQDSIYDALRKIPFRPSVLGEVAALRQHNESTAGPNNLKRGLGGSVDIEFIATTGQLRAMEDPSFPVRQGTIDALNDLANSGFIDPTDADTLISNYRNLRRIEAKLRWVNTVSRHELPLDRNDSIDTLAMRQLTALLGKTDPWEIIGQCERIRGSNRELFKKWIGPKEST